MGQDITTVFLDLGNVFFSHFTTRDPILGVRFLGKAIAEKGREAESHAFYRQSMEHLVMTGQRTEREHYREVIERFGLDFTVDFILERIVFEAYKNTWGILPRLKTAGYRLGVISNHAERWSGMALDTPSNEGKPFRDYFDYVILSWFYRCKKPDRKIFDIALAVSGARPEQCLFVDDDIRNVQRAEMIGISGFAYKYDVGERTKHQDASLYDTLKSQELERELILRGVHI